MEEATMNKTIIKTKPSPRSGDSPIENDDRATRLRDNKRRNRQRQKDYTTSLESKLKALQLQGVQATQEVQVSARKVVEDNTRLKALLRHVGVPDHVIENWNPNMADQSPEKGSGVLIDRWEPLTDVCSSSTTPLSQTIERAIPQLEQPIPSSTQNSTPNHHHNQPKTEPSDGDKSPSNVALKFQLPPCKILTRLAEDPSADVTQPTTTSSEWNAGDQENGGVECSKAHTMMMQFATTEEKLDVISQALERGCVKKAGGGCKVRNEAIWKAIDDVT